MIKHCPQWHLRSMKEHLPALVLGRFLFSFGFIFQVNILKKLWDTERFMAVLQMCPSILPSSGPLDLEDTKFLWACSSLAVTCTTFRCAARSWVMDFSTSLILGKWLTILSVITPKVSSEVEKMTHEELQKCWPSNILKLWGLLSSS